MLEPSREFQYLLDKCLFSTSLWLLSDIHGILLIHYIWLQRDSTGFRCHSISPFTNPNQFEIVRRMCYKQHILRDAALYELISISVGYLFIYLFIYLLKYFMRKSQWRILPCTRRTFTPLGYTECNLVL